MKTYTLSNGVKMPAFGLGTFKVEAGESTYETVLNALKIGYRHIDTAMMYQNEEDVGRAIRDSKIPREEIFVTTKVVKQYQGDVSKIKADIDGSLNRLNIGYVDLLLMHWPNQKYEMNALVWSIFEDYYQQGKFRAIGVSNFQKHHLNELLKTAKVKPMVNQIECHPLLQQNAMLEYLKAHNIQMTSYGPFAKGKVFESPTIDVLNEIASHYNATVAQVIIAWGLSRDIVMIPKSVHYERLEENFNGQRLALSAKDLEKLSQLNRALRVYSDPDNNNFTE
ncbi:aldo/keto reductase [Acholeplasma equirhinis]|uniref:aldo/keto reductase n=1 Tax=Acholeplasma equirhinis TaxID=555393 RepID=UPI00197AD2B0|nr:aldo/keto reductase [Acholeplasma equirhinis]MBN3490639.1 aldo/keto reductase [Acholeplasma equirhinis]